MSFNTLGSLLIVADQVSWNFLTGLLGSMPLLLFSGLSQMTTSVTGLPWYVLTGGGLLGVLVVSTRTLSFPHVSMLNATLLLLMGQLGFGSLLDLYLGLPLRPELLAGGQVMRLSLAVGQLGALSELRLRPQKV